MTTTDTPKPGIYRDVPFATYLQWQAISNSRLNLAMQSLRHFKECKFKEQTTPMRLGTFIHAGILEPLAIPMRYAVQPRYELDEENRTQDGKQSTSTTTKYYKAKAAEFAAVNIGKEIIEQEFYEKLIGISRALAAHDRAREYLTERGNAELSLVWEDAETGLLCKARVDFANSGLNDLKTTQSAAKFSNALADYGYHRQAAHYQDGYATLCGGEIKPFRIIAAEPTEPYGVRAAPVSEEAIETGRSEVRKALRDIADAKESNNWPCYADPDAWNLPAWYGGKSDPIELTINGETVTI